MPDSNQHMHSLTLFLQCHIFFIKFWMRRLLFSHADLHCILFFLVFPLWYALCPHASSVCCRYGSYFEEVDMGRWVKHVADKRNITVKYIALKSSVQRFQGYLRPLPASDSDAEHRACPSSVMPGIGMATAPVIMTQQNVTTWEECRDLCCEKHDTCISWTLSLAEKTCFLRAKLGTFVKQNEDVISGITKSHVLPAPRRDKELRFYLGILSAPKNHGKVNMSYQ